MVYPRLKRMEYLQHNGVLVPPRYKPVGLTITVRGGNINLSPEAEEMAVAWAKKIGTPYVEDKVFAENFHKDFSKKLGVQVNPGDVDYSEVIRFVEEQKAAKNRLSREEKKRQAAERKTLREQSKERYGYAIVDGVKVELGNYTVEPNSIFMGRGNHPKRGSWKEGPVEEDIELNLSPDALIPPGRWKGVVWDPDSMWIARWRDKLSGKMKYVWFSDSSFLKQRKEIEKFEKARELSEKISKVQRHILDNLDSEDLKRRKTATVCFLIDKLKIRVGDEKDPDEADTVGASTLRPEHVCFNGDGTVTFDFLGKDSVRHTMRVKLPPKVLKNLREFKSIAKFSLFEGIDSNRVSEFLDEVVEGLSAKVFRTYYASQAVEKNLKDSNVKPSDPDYVKKHASVLANLEAARVCNHKKTIPKNWESSLEKKKSRLKSLKEKAGERQRRYDARIKDLEEKYVDRMSKVRSLVDDLNSKLKAVKESSVSSRTVEKHIASLKKSIRDKERMLKSLKSRHLDQVKKIKEQKEKSRLKDAQAIESLELQIEAQKKTKDYNLGTSLKSYIDPRIYHNWGKAVNYDWRKYYPSTLQKKFSWIELEQDEITE
ncbi:DNA topoisomerase I [Candidatus Bathyarchaeota archaeon]|nr:DNA topoisomerase I [Candidatus Bathyarchaeota archaeon]MBS7630765.1 DNA topoisomerase I [Candidatus Bathyarchaeota archaeon]